MISRFNIFQGKNMNECEVFAYNKELYVLLCVMLS